MSAAPPQPADERQQAIDQDLKDLKRGLAVNYAGYVIKLAHPALLILVTRSYGADNWGVYVAAQSALMIIARICIMGLDKALLWWIPQQPDHARLTGVRSCLTWTTGLAALATAGLALFAAPWVAAIVDAPETTIPLRIMAFALIPMVLLEMTVNIGMGARRMEPNVVARETVLPISMVAGALALFPLGWGANGIAVAFSLSYAVALVVAVIMVRKIFRGEADAHEGLRPPQRIITYATPMWGAEMANSFLLRVDVAMVTYFSGDMAVVGVYGVVVQIANTIRNIRRSFDPILLAITSKVGTTRDNARLAAGYSYATAMVIATQLPILVFLLLFAEWLIPLFGKDFTGGEVAVVILCGFWVVNSATSLAGVVVAAYGHSVATLLNTLGTALAQLILLWQLVPAYGLEGAAVAVGLAYTLQSTAQLLEMRHFTGGFHYRADVIRPVIMALIAGAALWAVYALVPDPGALWARIGMMAAFAIIYGAGVFGLAARKRP